MRAGVERGPDLLPAARVRRPTLTAAACWSGCDGDVEVRRPDRPGTLDVGGERVGRVRAVAIASCGPCDLVPVHRERESPRAGGLGGEGPLVARQALPGAVVAADQPRRVNPVAQEARAAARVDARHDRRRRVRPDVGPRRDERGAVAILEPAAVGGGDVDIALGEGRRG